MNTVDNLYIELEPFYRAMKAVTITILLALGITG
jgi:hypothetical protein